MQYTGTLSIYISQHPDPLNTYTSQYLVVHAGAKLRPVCTCRGPNLRPMCRRARSPASGAPPTQSVPAHRRCATSARTTSASSAAASMTSSCPTAATMHGSFRPAKDPGADPDLVTCPARPPGKPSASVAATSRQTALQMSAADPWQAAARARRLVASSACRVAPGKFVCNARNVPSTEWHAQPVNEHACACSGARPAHVLPLPCEHHHSTNTCQEHTDAQCKAGSCSCSE